MKCLKKLFAACLLLPALACTVSAQVNISTWQVNLQHTGNNANETILTPGIISSPGNFGLLFTQTLDGQSGSPLTISGLSFGQPLLASGINVGGTTHNIVYVATEHCSLWAFDADNNAGSNENPLWRDNLAPAGTIPVPQSVVGSGDIPVELGITTTPVIDMSSSTIYIVAKVQRTSDTTYHQYLYALDLATGTAKFGSPVEINPTFPGTSPDSSGGVIPFNALREHMRAAMTLYNGILYLTYASHSDTTPYHGEIIGYNATTLQPVAANSFITTPNGEEGGIWQAGAGPAFDGSGNMFVSVANGAWDQSNPSYGTDWSESMLRLSTSGTLSVSYANTTSWFTPNIWANLNDGDLDLGSGGLLLLPNQAGPHTHIMVGGGKGAVLYVVDRDNLSGINTPDNSIQEIPEINGGWLFITPAYYNGYIYYSTAGGPLEQRAVGYNPVDGSYISTVPVTSTNLYNVKGDGCFISSSGTTNGIVWILNGSGLDAYNATNVSGSPIFTTNATLPGNISCQNEKFSLPMEGNGKVYFAAYDSNDTGHLLVYGLLPAPAGSPAAPSDAVATPTASTTVTVTWSSTDTNESGYIVSRSTSPTGPFTQTGATTNAGVTVFYDTGLTPSTTYYYQVVATNENGNSNATNVASATTFPYYSENGLVAYWSMDETTGNTVHDDTGNGNTGTINGEAGLAAGFINNGVNFHGTGQATSQVAVSNTSSLQFAINQSFTISAWVYPSAVRGSEETIIAKSRDQGNYYGIWINAGNEWVFRGPGGDIVGPTATEDAWTHVAVVQDGVAGTRALYVNGVLAATGTAQAGDGAGALWMAQQNVSGAYESFPGTLDEVRIYNRAVPAGQITDLMGPPVLEGLSTQTHGNAGAFSVLVWPYLAAENESREGSTTGQYYLMLNFSAPVSPGITATLGLQHGGTPVGSVSSVTYNPAGTAVTVVLTGVGNDQALNLHLSGIVPGNGTADIPFNVLWGDVNSDNVVNALDLSIEQNNQTPLVNSSNFIYDINCDGAVNSTDNSLVSSVIGTSLGQQISTNLALFQPAEASTQNGGNVIANAFDGNFSTRWESEQGADPQWISVDLGSVCTINEVVLDWETAAGGNYTINVSNNNQNWTTIQTVTGNTASGIHAYTGLNATGRYVQMYGTTRDTQYGYSLWEFQVIGLSGTGSSSAPSITGVMTAPGTVGTALSYPITATNSPTSYAATGLPAGLGINTSTGLISGMPTTSGTISATINASNASGIGNSATLTIPISPATSSAPVITSATTATGTAGSSFSYSITATNSPASYNATGLPGGLSVNTSSGAITGTPASAGTTSAIISAINASGTGSATLTISVISSTGTSGTGQAPVITSGLTATGTAGSAFSYQITASNNPASYNASGLPAGLSVSTSSGLVSGTPTTAGTTSVALSAINASGTGPATLTITINANSSSSAPAITSGTMMSGTVGVAFNYQITATNGPTSYNATGLPSGLVFNTTTGVINGSPNASGATEVTISAMNASGTGSATLTVPISSGTLANLAYNQPAYASSVNGANTPNLAFDENTSTRWESLYTDPQWIYVDLGSVCNIYSVVLDWETAAGENYEIDVSNDAANWTAIQIVTGNTTSGIHTYSGLNATGRYVRMNGTTRDTGYGYSLWEFQVFGVPGPAPVITSGTAAATVGSAFVYQIVATMSPTSYTATGLPAGLALNTSTGLISGTPSASGTTTVPVSALNASGTASGTLTIMANAAVTSAPVVTGTLTVSGTVGVAFNYQVAATNSPTSYSATGLPSGLVFNTNTGVINGSPNNPGASDVNITVSNGNGTDSTMLVIAISPGTVTNLAYNQLAFASSVTGANTPNLAFDENTSTRWESLYTDPQWIYVDLGSVFNISSVVLDWENAAGENYEIDVSNDAANWTAIQTVTGNTTSGIHTYSGLNATGRYVRMYGTTRDTGYGYSLLEFQVFGSAIPPVSVAETSLSSKLSISGSSATVTFNGSVIGHTYQLQYSGSLSGGTWQNYGTAQAGNGGILVFPAPYSLSTQREFYRFQIQQQ